VEVNDHKEKSTIFSNAFKCGMTLYDNPSMLFGHVWIAAKYRPTNVLPLTEGVSIGLD
jgi:hypothetical protein